MSLRYAAVGEPLVVVFERQLMVADNGVDGAVGDRHTPKVVGLVAVAHVDCVEVSDAEIFHAESHSPRVVANSVVVGEVIVGEVAEIERFDTVAAVDGGEMLSVGAANGKSVAIPYERLAFANGVVERNVVRRHDVQSHSEDAVGAGPSGQSVVESCQLPTAFQGRRGDNVLSESARVPLQRQLGGAKSVIVGAIDVPINVEAVRDKTVAARIVGDDDNAVEVGHSRGSHVESRRVAE